MMRQPDPPERRHADHEGMDRLGPPGWAEFSAARERFLQTVAVAGLESAWSAPTRDAPELREEGRP